MFLEILYFLTIRPLEILFETIFFISYRFIGKPFATIIALSIFVNILVLPLYKRADKLQAEQREREKAMEGMLSHIKKTFKGDERVMMTQAYYRICEYKPVYALRGASSLLLQIPFFISAYRFLSGLELIKGMPSILLNLPGAAGPAYLIKDLGAPDAMFSVHGIAINVLPILMTLINIVSGTIYSKGHLKKEKVQLYVTALVFLVLLYNSPAGLVMYWTFNNIFSLLKNAVQKMFESRKNAKEEEVLKKNDASKVYNCLFLACALLMALMTGLFIPSNVLSASATEFVNTVNFFNPSVYLVYSTALGIGFFVIWVGIYYLFSPENVRKIFSCVMSVICACSVVNYMMSGSGLGKISANLKYDTDPVFEIKKKIINVLLILCCVIVLGIILKIKTEFVNILAMAGCAALICISVVNIAGIRSQYDDYAKKYASSDAYSKMPEIKLSKTGKNVILILLDRAMGPEVLYMLNERPDLMDTYDGFTFYHDTVSFSDDTLHGAPPVFGGYEYTPEAMNARDNELLSDKHNEALKVLPVAFLNEGYGVTVFDPPYAGYEIEPDLSIYDDYPDINAYISNKKLMNLSDDFSDSSEKRRKRNFYYFGVMKSMPLFVQGLLYDDGDYNFENDWVNFTKKDALQIPGIAEEEDHVSNENTKTTQTYSPDFYGWYSVLDNLEEITEIDENEKGEFLMFYNAETHDSNLLQLPDYTYSEYVDNTAYDLDEFYTINGVTMHMDTRYRVGYYSVNMAGLLRIGEWLEYLKKEGVYDNTRIIITSDHGGGVGWFYGFTFDGILTDWFAPMLLVKDFDEHGFKVSSDFMTNADACVFAAGGDALENPVNPFTGNRLDGHEKEEGDLKVMIANGWDPREHKGTKYNTADWYAITGTPYDANNWKYIGNY